MASLPDDISQAVQEWLRGSGSHSINILVTGKTGVGKSSLINCMFGKGMFPEVGDRWDGNVKSVTVRFIYHDVDTTVWNSSGLQDGLYEEVEYIRDMISKGRANFDLVLYCNNMNDNRLRTDDQNAIRELTIGLGKQIWNNAVFVMTFANAVQARCELGQKLTPSEECKRNRDFFKKRLEKWKNKLVDAVVVAGVDSKIAASIPIVPAGCDEEQALPDRDDWLACFHCIILSRIKHSQSALLMAFSFEFPELPNKITQDDLYKQSHTHDGMFACNITQ